MNTKKVSVKQRKNESIDKFIERVLEKQEEKETEVEAVFNNEVSLMVDGRTTKNSMKRAYENSVTEDDDIELSDDELEENISEDLVLEEVSVDEELSLDEEELEENITEENELEEDELVENISNALNNQAEEFITENKRGTVDLESLDILSNEAMKYSIYRDIDQEQLEFVYESYENMKQELAALRAEKIGDAKAKYETINSFTQQNIEQKNEFNKRLDERKEFLIKEKEEYERIYNEYENEKQQLENACNELHSLFKEDKEVRRHLEVSNMFNKMENIQESNYDIINGFLKNPVLRRRYSEQLKEIAKLKWNVEAYQEYIPVYAKEEEYEKIKEELETIDEKKITNDDIKKQTSQYIGKMFEGVTFDENGKPNYNTENDPEIVELREKISITENFINDMKKHPLTLKKEIAGLMAEGKSPEVIEDKLNELVSNIESSQISVLYDKDKKEVLSVETKIEIINSQISELENKIENDTYIDEDLVAIDADKLNNLKLYKDELDAEIKYCESLLENKKDNDELKSINKKIKKYENMISDIKKQKSKMLLLNKDADVSNFDKMIENCVEGAKGLVTRKAELIRNNKEKEVKKKGSFYTEIKLKDLINKRENCENEIVDLEKEIEDKKSNEGYIDFIAKETDLIELEKLKEEKTYLETLKDSMILHNVKDIKTTILNKYQNKEEVEQEFVLEEDNELTNDEVEPKLEETELSEEELEENISVEEDEVVEEFDEELEEIVDYKPLPRRILDKIKSIDFKKAAITAIAGLTIAATVITGALIHRNNNEKKEQETKARQEAIFTEEDAREATETLTQKIDAIIEQQEHNEIEDEQIPRTESYEIKDDLNTIDYEKIATSADRAASGNFINPDTIYEPSFENAELKEYQDNIYQVVNNDQVIGYTVDDSNEIERTR